MSIVCIKKTLTIWRHWIKINIHCVIHNNNVAQQDGGKNQNAEKINPYSLNLSQIGS